MEFGRKLRELREEKHLSQRDIEKKIGLFRNYTSRVENGMTIPSIENLESMRISWEFLYIDSSQTVKR
jgi:transcriptional regulator with XRE-family HTH domain